MFVSVEKGDPVSHIEQNSYGKYVYLVMVLVTNFIIPRDYRTFDSYTDLLVGVGAPQLKLRQGRSRQSHAPPFGSSGR